MALLEILPPEIDTNLETPGLRPAAETPHLSGEIKEEGVFSSLVSSFRDVFFPAKLPPLVLESTPIAVIDPMKTKRSAASTATAAGLHVVVILLIAYLIAHQVHKVIAPPATVATNLTAPPPPPPPVLPKLERMGGGGGQHDLAPVTQGHLPKFADKQIVPPKAPPVIQPKLAVEPTLVMQKDLKLADNNMPNLGLPTSSLKGVSLGNGSGTGLGSGNGAGIGPGSGGNMGGGVMHVGGTVRAPVVIYQVDPEFSEEARKAKFSGNVEVYLWVDENGNPSHIRVARGVGMGLDEKAKEAVAQYKFKPAMQNGKAVKVDLVYRRQFPDFLRQNCRTDLKPATTADFLYAGHSARSGFHFLEREVIGLTAGFFLPSEEQSSVARGRAVRRLNPQAFRSAIDPLCGAFEFGIRSNWRLIQHQVSTSRIRPFGAELLVRERRFKPKLMEYFRNGRAVFDAGLCLNAGLVLHIIAATVRHAFVR